MTLHIESQLAGSILQPNNNWDISVQKQLSAFKNPDYLIGPRVDLLQGDISREWFKWIVDQFVDKRFFNEKTNFFEIYTDVRDSIELLIGNQKDEDDKQKISELISISVEQRINFLKQDDRNRKNITTTIKEDLLTIYGQEPRCWLTGLKFSQEAVFNFTAKKVDKQPIQLPTFVDRYRPIGTNERDLCIEVDHLFPFSYGGPDDLNNYRLICGWANRVKSNHITGYSTGTKVSGASKLFPTSFYYWVIRTLGLKRKCEVAGCNNNITNSELTVCSQLGSSKAITPVSMKVICKDHDNRENRYIRRDSVKERFLL
ncbi:hypothetical protein D1814_07060 [Alteromonas sp. BL110]|uniref:hypothetical protein n=1 Tax=Alteromonas sp. BL110 TaxID=1714845 RepID=UPI000E4FDC7F|nr:hypothetical protein [Alteromonas sp. BL110]AXT38445.1 hypothetical protein D1814_07060 [Alteromonas sp. BL110]RKM83810.1 hypothetical protein D7031_01870 [Alteromonas sp. BL110]